MGIEDILADKREEILAIADKYGAHNVRVFGSVARGEAAADSDVDFVVRFELGRSLLDQSNLILDLEELLGRRVDVASEKWLNEYIRDRVLSEATPL